MGNGKEKSNAINSLVFSSVLETLCLVRRRDVEYFSRWSFECNLHEIWGCYRRHMSEWCLQITSEMGNGKEKSHAIISWFVFSVLVVLSLVGHRDVEYNSRWSFGCNLQEIWTCYRPHMSEWCLQITSEMGDGKGKSHAINSRSFFSVLEKLSLVRHRDVECRWSFECNLQEIWTHLCSNMSEWCLHTSYFGDGQWEGKIPCDHLFVISLRSFGIISRYASRRRVY